MFTIQQKYEEITSNIMKRVFGDIYSIKLSKLAFYHDITVKFESWLYCNSVKLTICLNVDQNLEVKQFGYMFS